MIQFLCHGTRGEDGTDLLLEDDDRVRLATASVLLEGFRTQLSRRPVLCFLAACESGAGGSRGAYVALGRQLVTRGSTPRSSS